MKFLYLILFVLATKNDLLINAELKEYASIDDPPCTTDCSSIREADKRLTCYKEQLSFHNYKLVKSIFNYGKTAIYAGLWSKRYEKSDEELFERVFNDTISEYSAKNLLGNVDYKVFQSVVTNLYKKFKPYTFQNTTIEYDKYPSLKCPTPCTYEIVTWQTLVGLSIGIFVLALLTTGIYSIYLHKQYSILRTRMRNIKYTKIIN